ncbi:hypothetical protein [Xanthomonas arboricola]|uniref:hypothetical protein n=1 Tax=Xanthomonas arboricola TaxID=56448 RepID=UPI004040BB81
MACTVLSSGKPGYGVPMVACVDLWGRQNDLAAKPGGGVLTALRGGADKSRVLAPDYKAIGNSMAVPCVAWLGQRLVQCLPKTGSSASN